MGATFHGSLHPRCQLYNAASRPKLPGMQDGDELRLVGKGGEAAPAPAPPSRGGLAWLGRHELGFILGLAVICAGIWAVVALVDAAIVDKEAQPVDEQILLAMRNPHDLTDPVGPRWLEEMGRDMTALGGIAFQILLIIAVGGYLAMRRARRALLLLVVAIGGGFAISMSLKNVFARPRPNLVPHGSIVYTASFPSGHSMMSTVTFLTLAVMLARIEPRKRIKAFFLSLAFLLALVVGLSRVYLGVHWPTDVLAGWCLGLVWATICWLVMHTLQRKGNVEAPASEAGELQKTGAHL